MTTIGGLSSSSVIEKSLGNLKIKVHFTYFHTRLVNTRQLCFLPMNRWL
jgi:hypothetical protein